MKRAQRPRAARPSESPSPPDPAAELTRALRERARRVAEDAERIRRAARQACADRTP